jgi:hypothetical protein
LRRDTIASNRKGNYVSVNFGGSITKLTTAR